ncbi:glutaredoxin-like protein NrdH [Kocuria sp. cx-455]|uniref:glutaredoxin-like protein NrdH n=1 Tax=unclassified Candidatus Sulfotelmatobacter TaxID=2635724 RepID=UPI0016876008|nr:MULTISPECIES: glutaredoxin-like protein NrdH [unclassified Candidatus Sulfotelmatobacter]MBD2761294.1 glutaredoxin-like protein NrdH [Kocuria sp. cx-116]MBD2764921.1 glutaredoxin-like protein NrdH [Kocuria sp. cx-455]
MSVTVYSKPSCVQCNATYRALTKKGIDYTVVDVTEDQDAYQHVVSLGYQQVPVVETAQDHWSGYRPDKINSLAVLLSA